MLGLDASLCSGNGGSVAARIADLYAEEDRAQMEKLTRQIEEGCRCRYCGRQIPDDRMVRSPGLCSAKRCRGKAARGR